MKDLRVELKIKNNALYSAIMGRYDSVAAFCRDFDFIPQVVGSYLNFKTSPITVRKNDMPGQKFLGEGQYVKQSAINIAKALDRGFFDIFPPVSYEAKTNKFSAEVDSQTFIPFDDTVLLPILSDPEIEDYEPLYAAIGVLSDVEQNIIKLRFGLDSGHVETLESCADRHGVSRERIKQIESRALRKLRHPKNTRQVIDMVVKGDRETWEKP